MLGLIISIIVVGLIAGAVARLVVPGHQNLSIPMTILLGIIGSFVGGFLGYLLFGRTPAAASCSRPESSAPSSARSSCSSSGSRSASAAAPGPPSRRLPGRGVGDHGPTGRATFRRDDGDIEATISSSNGERRPVAAWRTSSTSTPRAYDPARPVVGMDEKPRPAACHAREPIRRPGGVTCGSTASTSAAAPARSSAGLSAPRLATGRCPAGADQGRLRSQGPATTHRGLPQRRAGGLGDGRPERPPHRLLRGVRAGEGVRPGAALDIHHTHERLLAQHRRDRAVRVDPAAWTAASMISTPSTPSSLAGSTPPTPTSTRSNGTSPPPMPR